MSDKLTESSDSAETYERCARGHELTPANSYYRRDSGIADNGRPRCKACIRLRGRVRSRDRNDYSRVRVYRARPNARKNMTERERREVKIMIEIARLQTETQRQAVAQPAP